MPFINLFMAAIHESILLLYVLLLLYPNSVVVYSAAGFYSPMSRASGTNVS